MIINWKEIIGQEQKGISGNYSFYNGGWVKKVEAVDKSQSNGYCFEGKFVREQLRAWLRSAMVFTLFAALREPEKSAERICGLPAYRRAS